MDNQTHKLQFFVTAPHDCNYLEEKEAASMFADPVFPKNKPLYSFLVENGFRRSGEHLYKPYCQNCSECIPIRIPVNEFEMKRQYKRNIKLNSDVTVTSHPASFNPQHFNLYKRYLSMRHKDGGMDNPTEENYQDFLWSDWSDTCLYEFWLDKQLMAVAVVDRLEAGNSAVYTFFEPELYRRSPGKFCILWLIEKTLQQGLDYLYLGYWIGDCGKMNYKINYQPSECYINGEWKRFKPLSVK